MSGMLASASTIEMLATAFKEYHVEKLILDPVSTPLEKSSSIDWPVLTR